MRLGIAQQHISESSRADQWTCGAIWAASTGRGLPLANGHRHRDRYRLKLDFLVFACHAVCPISVYLDDLVWECLTAFCI